MTLMWRKTARRHELERAHARAALDMGEMTRRTKWCPKCDEAMRFEERERHPTRDIFSGKKVNMRLGVFRCPNGHTVEAAI